MRALIVSLVCLPALAASAETQLKDELTKCAAVSSVMERLECFDRLAAGQKREQDTTASETPNITPETEPARGADRTESAAQAPRPERDWLIDRSKNPLDDKPIVSAGLMAESGENEYGRRPVLMLRCRSGRFEAYVNWSAYLGLESTRVTVRTDSRPARAESWSLSTNHVAAFAKAPVAFMQELSKSTTLILSVVPYSASPIISKFKLDGIGAVEVALRENCRLK